MKLRSAKTTVWNTLKGLSYLGKFAGTYITARRQAPAHLRLEETITQFLDERGLPSTGRWQRGYSPQDTSIDRRTVASFYRMAALHCFLGRQYADLMGFKLGHEHMRVLTTIGALAKIEDYIVDRLRDFPDQEHDRIYRDPHSYRPENLAGALFRDVYLRLLQLMPRDRFPEYYEVIEQVFEAQKDSRRQADPMTLDDLKDVTMRKGGYGIMAGLHVLNPHLTPDDAEYQALVSVGHWGQMVEDILDELEDRRQKLHTLVTEMAPAELAGEISRRRDESCLRFGRLSHYPPERRASCIFQLYLPTVPALVRLRQLARGQDILADIQQRRYLRVAAAAVNFVGMTLSELAKYDATPYFTGEQRTSEESIAA